MDKNLLTPANLAVSDPPLRAKVKALNITPFGIALPGDRYYYPSVTGQALSCTIVAKAQKSLIAKFGPDLKVYLAEEDFNAVAIPIIKDPLLRTLTVYDIQPDPDNKLIFIRYIRNKTTVDKIYNWWVSKFSKDVVK